MNWMGSQMTHFRSMRLWSFGLNSSLVLLSLLLLTTGIAALTKKNVLAGNADFAIFYSGVRLVREFPANLLYDQGTQIEVQKRIFGADSSWIGPLPYNHPPFELFFFFPLGFLSYRTAFLTWLGINWMSLLFLPVCLASLAPSILGRYKILMLLFALAFFPFLACLLQGQDTILFLWVQLGSYFLLKRKKDFWAGLTLGLSFFRFNIAYLIVLPFLLKSRRRILLGLVSSLTFLLMVSYLWIGYSGTQRYVNLLLLMSGSNQRIRNPITEEAGLASSLSDSSHPIPHPDLLVQSPQIMPNWTGQLYMLGVKGAHNLEGAILLGAIAFCLLCFLWKGKWDTEDSHFGLKFGGTLLVALLASPHVYIYNLSVVFLTLILFFEFLLCSKWVGWKSRLLSTLLLLSPVVMVMGSSALWGVVNVAVLWMTLIFFICLLIVWKRSATLPSTTALG
jgi:hypothetical protein